MCFWKGFAPAPSIAQIIFIVTLGIHLTQISRHFYKSLLSSVYKEVKKTWVLSSCCPDSWSEELCSEPLCPCNISNYIIWNKTKQSYLDSVWILLWLVQRKTRKYKYKCKLLLLWLECQWGHFNAIYRESVYIVLRRCVYFIFSQCIKLSECNNNSQLGVPLHRLLTNHCKHLYRAKHKTLMNRKKLETESCPSQGHSEENFAPITM